MPPASLDVARAPRKGSASASDDVRSQSIWRWQLVLAASVVGITLAIALLVPSMLARWQVAAGIIVIVATTVATLAVPWHRIDNRVVVAIPLIDVLAIGALSSGSDARLSFLWVFPVSWIATYYSSRWLAAGLLLIVAVLVTDAVRDTLSATLVLRAVIVSLSLTFIGITMNIGSRRTRAFRRLLQRQFAQTEASLVRVEVQRNRGAAVYNAIDAPLAGIAFDGTYVNANVAYRELYGIDDLDQPHPTTAVEYDDRRGNALPAAQTSVARAARGEEFTDERFWLFDVEGRWHALDISSKRIQAGAKEPESMLLSVADVTEVLEAERDKKTLTSVVSHELRNPLTAIIGRTELMLDDDELPDAARRQLLVIENAAERMQHLIGSLVDGARDAVDEEAADFDLTPLVAASVEAFRPAAELAEVELHNGVTAALGVVGDAFRLRQAIDNVIGNAVKYTPRGGSVLVSGSRVTVTGERDADGTVRLIVEDTGIGISADDLPKVFDPYFRSQSARDSSIPGTGLGMGITREIIQQQGGTLEIESTLGTGTRVIIALPARPEGKAS